MKILVIDDSNWFRVSLVSNLKNAGHDVIEASYRNEGVRMMIEKRPDFVITDNNMPMLSNGPIEPNMGVEIVRKSRRLMQFRPTIWLVSGDVSDKLRAEALSFGAEMVISKIHIFDKLREAKIIK